MPRSVCPQPEGIFPAWAMRESWSWPCFSRAVHPVDLHRLLLIVLVPSLGGALGCSFALRGGAGWEFAGFSPRRAAWTLCYRAGACRDFSCNIAVISTSSPMPLSLRFEEHRVWFSVYKITFAGLGWLGGFFFFLIKIAFEKQSARRPPCASVALAASFHAEFPPPPPPAAFPASPAPQCPWRSVKPRLPCTRLQLVRGTPRGLSVRPSIPSVLPDPLPAQLAVAFGASRCRDAGGALQPRPSVARSLLQVHLLLGGATGHQLCFALARDTLRDKLSKVLGAWLVKIRYCSGRSNTLE